jgi:hypothetical protein
MAARAAQGLSLGGRAACSICLRAIAFFLLSLSDLGDALGQRHLQRLRLLRRIHEVRDDHPGQSPADCPLDVPKAAFFLW